MILKSKLFKTAGVYIISNSLNAAIPFLILPILTRNLPMADVGLLSISNVLIGLTLPFVGLNSNGIISNKYVQRHTIDFRAFLFNIFLVFAGSALFTALLTFILSAKIGQMSGFPPEYLWMIVLIAAGQFISLVLLQLFQMEKRPVAYGMYRVSQTLLDFGLSVIMITSLGLGWYGRMYGQLTAAILFSAVAFVILFKNKKLNPVVKKDNIRDTLKFGIPLIPHIMGMMMLTMIDRFFIKNMVGLEAVGLYAVGYQFGMFISLLQNSFNQAWVPWFFEKLAAGKFEDKIRIVKFTYAYFAGILLFSLSFGLLAPFALTFIAGKGYEAAGDFIIWIALGYAFNGMYKMVTNFIFYVEKTYILAWLTFFTALIHAGLNYLFIGWFGVIGAAYATSISFFISFILTWILAARVYKMPWNLKLGNAPQSLS